MTADTHPARLSNNIAGALWMLLAAVAFTAMSSLVKFLGEGYTPGLQAFYRQLAGFAVLLPLILRDPIGAYRTNRLPMVLWRALAGFAAITLVFYSFQELPLAEANALSFTRALWLAPLAIIFLKERVGIWRLGATFVGFLGVLLILQPTNASAALGLPAFAALSAAALVAATLTSAKMLTRDHSVKSIMCWSSSLGLLLTLPFAIFEWRTPSLQDFVLLCLMGALSSATQAAYLKGMSLGDATAMAPLDYTRILFAVIVGFVVFHETPNPIALLGMAVVIGSTLVITLREARLNKRPPVPPGGGTDGPVGA
jgi:drug/metabolite transporter (DMT)-like permease